MTEKGFFTKQNKRHWWFFKSMYTDYSPTEKYDLAIKELEDLRLDVSDAILQKNPSKYLIDMGYAFPSEELTEIFLACPDKIDESVYEPRVAIYAAIESIIAKY